MLGTSHGEVPWIIRKGRNTQTESDGEENRQGYLYRGGLAIVVETGSSRVSPPVYLLSLATSPATLLIRP
jgi:hypothetical protein